MLHGKPWDATLQGPLREVRVRLRAENGSDMGMVVE
jgi:hypothetical protein